MDVFGLPSRRIRRRGAARRGGALVFAILAIATLALAGAVFLRRADQSRQVAGVTNRQALLNREVLASADLIRDKLTRLLDENLLPNAAHPAADLTGTDVDNVAAFKTMIDQFVTAFNSAHSDRQGQLSLVCTGQISELQGREPCTKRRSRDPKIFSLKFTQFDQEKGVYVQVEQEVIVKRTRINDYAYLLTGAPGDVRLGEITFTQPIGIFFDDPSAVNGILFTSSQGSGTDIQSVLMTNISNDDGLGQQKLVQVGTAKFTISRIAWGESSKDFVSAIGEQFGNLRTDSTTKNHQDGEGLAPGYHAMLTECTNRKDSSFGGVGSCDVKRLGQARFEIGETDCSLRIVDTYGWVLTVNGIPRAAGNNSADRTDLPPVDGQSVVDVIYNGTQVDGAVYYLPGEAWVRGDMSNPRQKSSRLCARQTFLADSIVLKNSLLSSDTKLNSALFANDTIKLAENDGSKLNEAFIFDVGTGLTLSEIKSNSGLTLTEAVRIQASIVPGQDGSFVIPSVFYDSNPLNGNNPKFLGKMSTRGMFVTKLPTISSAKYLYGGYTYRSGGFTKVEMSAVGLQFPPPGLNFAINSNLKSLVSSSSLSLTSVDEAISAVSGGP